MRKHIKKMIVLFLLAVAVSSACAGLSTINAASLTASSNPVKLLNDYIGRYKLNYTGNTNHFDSWWTGSTQKVVSFNYKDRADIVSENNSTGMLTSGASDARIARAFLVWETRSSSGVNTPIRLYTPKSGTSYGNISAQYACVDTRTAPDGSWTYNSLYCMAADVTDIVQDAGYGAYTVANIPVWQGIAEGDSTAGTGGESVASWQLIIVEESETYSVKNVTLSIASKFYMQQSFGLSMNSVVASKSTGKVNGQIFYGTSNSGMDRMVENYETFDVNGNKVKSGVSNATTQAGLYKNGAAFNTRDQGATNGWANGTVRMSLSDITDIGNDVTRLRMFVENSGWTTTFVMGMAYDINMYTVSYDGNGAQSGWVERTSCLFNQNYTISDNGFSYKYHRFTGWNTKADGSGKWWYPGDTYSNLCSISGDDYKLYAQWETLGAMITLDNQGADIKAGTPKYFEKYNDRNYTDDDCKTPINQIVIPQKTGYTFAGYFTGKNGAGTKYVAADGKILSDATTFTQDTTLYAKWEPGVYKITLDNQGAQSAGTTCYYEKYGVGNYADEACTVPITNITLPEKRGHAFAGYWAEPEGNGTLCVTTAGVICTRANQFTQDTTIYANWTPKTYTIWCDNQGATFGGSSYFNELYGVSFYYDATVLSAGTTAIPYNYTGNVQHFVAPYTGNYTLQVWGAQGGGVQNFVANNAFAQGGLGGYSQGDIWLAQGQVIYIYVGGKGDDRFDTQIPPWLPNGEYNYDEKPGGWNGGGVSHNACDGAPHIWGAGGGGTDIRINGNSVYDRVIVAGGGGGAVALRNQVLSGGSGGQQGVLYAIQGGQIIRNTSIWTGGRFDYYTADYTTFYCGNEAGGGGWYGGRSWYRNTNYAGNGYLYLPQGEGGSNYTGGVSNGTSLAGIRSGNGYAVITRSNYTSQYTATTRIEKPSRDGYTFLGYYTGLNGTGQQIVDAHGNIVVATDYFATDATIYAYWVAGTVAVPNTLTVDPNGGTWNGSTGIQSISLREGETSTISNPNREGYRFAGWTLTGAGSSLSGTTFTMGTENATLKANWTLNSYTIIFNPNSGAEITPIQSVVVRYDEEITLPDATDVYIKYTLDGVNVTQDVLSGAIVLNDAGVVVMMLDEDVEEIESAGDTEMDTTVGEDIESAQTNIVEDTQDVPQPNKKAYESVFMGWSMEEEKDTFVPQWTVNEPVNVSTIVDMAGKTNEDGAVITLYAVWDDCPWIVAENLYYTLEQAQSGFITDSEILNHATASDREDGSPIAPGFHENGTSFSIPDYLPTDFTQFQHEGSCTENLTVVDSVGSTYAKQITVYVVDTTPVTVKPEGTTRFINEYYYNQPYEKGGLEENSIWKTDPEYVAALKTAFDNLNNNTPVQTYYFTHDVILQMQDYVDAHGVGNTKEPDALQNFYEQFMAPNLQ